MARKKQTDEAADQALDLSEKGRQDGKPISLDRRLFLKFTAFGECNDVETIAYSLEAGRVRGALYLDAHDPYGIGIVAMSESPDYFVDELRDLFDRRPFQLLRHKPQFDMLGRTYTIGYESDLEHVLFTRPASRITDPELRWAVWYPLRRSGRFAALPADDQRRILAEHGTLGKRYGEAGLAHDIRLACHGLDRDDNDFIVGLLGADLFPLSSVVQAMRGTEQTSQYLDRLGPFFVGRAAWQSEKIEDWDGPPPE